MSNVTFKTLKDKNNQSEFIQFVQDLPDEDRIKLLTTIQKIEEEGIQIAIRMKWVKKLDNNLYEKNRLIFSLYSPLLILRVLNS